MISFTVFTCKMNLPKSIRTASWLYFLTEEFLKKFQSWPGTILDCSALNTNTVSLSYTGENLLYNAGRRKDIPIPFAQGDALKD